MKKLLVCKVIFGLACLALLSQPAEAESYRSGLKKGAKAHLEYYSAEIRKLEDGGKICSLGIQSKSDGIITRVLDSRASIGVQPGDKIATVDGKEITSENLSEVLSTYAPGDSLIVSVDRSGTMIDLEVVCGDRTDRSKAFISMAQSAAKGRWQKCIDQSYVVDRLNGGAIALSAIFRQNCHEAIRCGSFGCKDPTIETSRLLYDKERLRIEEAVFVAGELNNIRSRVMGSISWLEEYGSRNFARELESVLRAAESSLAPKVAKGASPQKPRTGYGTCFAVSDTEILTSHHVVANANQITVWFRDGVEKGAVVLEHSRSTDLALLKLNGMTPSFLPLAPTRSLEIGQEIFTVGFPVSSILGSAGKFTEGSVSALSGIQGDASYFQMSVPIQPGSSGGPVLNMQGEVVGVVASTAAIEVFYSMSGSLPQNVNWASKSDYARLLFDVPDVEKRAEDRSDAIEMAYSAVCQIKAVMN